VPEADLDRLAQVVLDGLLPSLTVVLDLDPEVSLVRVAARNGADPRFRETRFDGEALAFHRAVRTRFLAIAGREPQRVAVVPALDGPDQVAAAIWARVAPLLAAAGHRVA
jgi:dTMP kinase